MTVNVIWQSMFHGKLCIYEAPVAPLSLILLLVPSIVITEICLII